MVDWAGQGGDGWTGGAGGWMGRGRLTTGERTKCSAKKPRLLRTAPHSIDSDGPAPCAGFSAGRVSLHCSRGTPRSACARGGQGSQVTLGWMCRGTGVSGGTLDGWGAQGSEITLRCMREHEIWGHPWMVDTRGLRGHPGWIPSPLPPGLRDSHDEGCNAYGPDVGLWDGTLAFQELGSWGGHR